MTHPVLRITALILFTTMAMSPMMSVGAATQNQPAPGEVVVENGLSPDGLNGCAGTVRMSHAPQPNEPFGRFRVEVNPDCVLRLMWQPLEPPVTRGELNASIISAEFLEIREPERLFLEGKFAFEQSMYACPETVAAVVENGIYWRTGTTQESNTSARLPTEESYASSTGCSAAWSQWWTSLIGQRSAKITTYLGLVAGDHIVNPWYYYSCELGPRWMGQDNLACAATDATVPLPGRPDSQHSWRWRYNLAW